MTTLLILLLLLSAPGQAQPRQKKPTAKPKVAVNTQVKWPIESLKVEGNANYTAEQILAVADVKKGQSAGKAEFEEARNRLVGTGAFESVGYRFEPSSGGTGYAASFQVVEVSQVYPYRFERLDAPDAQLEEALKRSNPLFAPKIPGTQAVLDRYVKAIESFLASHNKKETVIARLTSDGPDRVVIVFRPEAPPPSVAEVKFAGNKVLPSTVLQNAIAGVAIGSVYSEKTFRQFLDTSIRPLYEARGRIQVSFPTIGTEEAKEVKGLVVTVEVAEGESFNLGGVRFEGASLPPEELRRAGDFKTGDVADFAAVQAGLDRIKKRLRREGYMHPDTRVERQVHDKEKTVDLLVHIEEGRRYLFGNLKLQGLDILGEAAVRRLWTMKSGAPFNADYPDYFLQRIREDNVFDNLGKTKSALAIDDEKLMVDVTLIFQ